MRIADLRRPGEASAGAGAFGGNHMARRSIHLLALAGLVGATGLCGAAGCHEPEKWSYTGPRVYLIRGADGEPSTGLFEVRDRLRAQEINAEIYSPDNWLKIVVDIDSKPDEEVILVGHGHGAFLATQVVRHYAQQHKMKHIDAVFTLDAYNKDWPHNARERGEEDPHEPPMDTPVGHNALKVRNYVQRNPDSAKWGSEMASTRASNIREEHPYYWYDDYWDRRPVMGQKLKTDVTPMGVRHETIDNPDRMVQRITHLCRKAALSPYHYTPPEHHVDVAKRPASSGYQTNRMVPAR